MPSQWREETGPHGAKRWVNLRTGRIQYRDPGSPHPSFVAKQKEERSKQEQKTSEQSASHEQGQLSEPNKNLAKVVDTSAFDAYIKQHKTPELWRGVPKKEHGEQFKTGDLRQGSGAYGPGIYVGYGYNGRDTASKAAGDEGVMTRMTLKPDAKVMTWDEAETTWEKEGKQEFSIEKYDSSEKAIAAWAKSNGVDALDVQHNEFMNVLNPQALVVEKPKEEHNTPQQEEKRSMGNGIESYKFTPLSIFNGSSNTLEYYKDSWSNRKGYRDAIFNI